MTSKVLLWGNAMRLYRLGHIAFYLVIVFAETTHVRLVYRIPVLGRVSVWGLGLASRIGASKTSDSHSGRRAVYCDCLDASRDVASYRWNDTSGIYACIPSPSLRPHMSHT
jgi:hypothetical protein